MASLPSGQPCPAGWYRVPPLRSVTPYHPISFTGCCRYRGRNTSLWSVILLGCSTSLAGLYSVPPLRFGTPYSQISFIGYCRYRGRNDLPLVGIPAWHSSRLWLFPPPLTTGQSGVVGSPPTATNSRTSLLSWPSGSTL